MLTIQVLTQSRKHIIKKTFDSLAGVKKAVVHLYNSTSLAQREQVFRKEKPEIIKIATDGAAAVKRIRSKIPGDEISHFEYSPESFTGTEVDFAAEIMQCRDRYLGTDPGKQGDHQSAIHSGNVHATRIRIADRISCANSSTTGKTLSCHCIHITIEERL